MTRCFYHMNAMLTTRSQRHALVKQKMKEPKCGEGKEKEGTRWSRHKQWHLPLPAAVLLVVDAVLGSFILEFKVKMVIVPCLEAAMVLCWALWRWTII